MDPVDPSITYAGLKRPALSHAPVSGRVCRGVPSEEADAYVVGDVPVVVALCIHRNPCMVAGVRVHWRVQFLGLVSKKPVLDHLGLGLEAEMSVVEPRRTVVVRAGE